MSRSLLIVAMFALSTAAFAAELPKSGSARTASAWKAVGETTQIGGRSLSHGMLWGIVTDDNPLRIKSAMCPYISEQNGDTNLFTGRCAWSDADGDQVFSEWTAKLSISTGVCEGPQTITGGSGKFRGIQGSIPFQCQAVSDKGQFTSALQWSYRLP